MRPLSPVEAVWQAWRVDGELHGHTPMQTIGFMRELADIEVGTYRRGSRHATVLDAGPREPRVVASPPLTFTSLRAARVVPITAPADPAEQRVVQDGYPRPFRILGITWSRGGHRPLRAFAAPAARPARIVLPATPTYHVN